MTLAELKAKATALGFTARKVDGEYQLFPKGTNTDHPSSYFTNDIDDAAGTLEFMARVIPKIPIDRPLTLSAS